METLEKPEGEMNRTPAGIGPLADGDQVEVEVEGVGILRNTVALREEL